MGPAGERAEERQQEREIEQQPQSWARWMLRVAQGPVGKQQQDRRQTQQVVDDRDAD